MLSQMTNAKLLLRQVTLKLNRRDSSCMRNIGRSMLTSSKKGINGAFLSQHEKIHMSQTRDTFYQVRSFVKPRGTSSIGDVLNEELASPELDNVQDLKTSEDMDFYDPLTFEYYPTQEDQDEEKEMEEARRQAIREELDSRSGRLWKDRWELTDEDWSSGKSYDDLPDWTEELCSRVSRERVRVHPGKFMCLRPSGFIG
jgi:hypothetical protein